MKAIGIIGYGRFGKVLKDLFLDNYEVRIYDKKAQAISSDIELESLERVLDCEIVFIAIPIRYFEDIIKDIAQYKLYNTYHPQPSIFLYNL